MLSTSLPFWSFYEGIFVQSHCCGLIRCSRQTHHAIVRQHLLFFVGIVRSFKTLCAIFMNFHLNLISDVCWFCVGLLIFISDCEPVQCWRPNGSAKFWAHPQVAWSLRTSKCKFQGTPLCQMMSLRASIGILQEVHTTVKSPIESGFHFKGPFLNCLFLNYQKLM